MQFVIRLDGVVDGVPMATVDVRINDTWQASYRLVAQGQRVALADVRVWPRPGAVLPQGGLPAGVLRQLRVGAVVNHLSRMIALLWFRPGTEAPRGSEELAKAFPFLRADAPPRTPRKRTHGTANRPGRPRLNELLLASAANAYLDAIKRRSRRPVQEAAKQIRERPQRLRDLLHRARSRGLLTEVIKTGVAGGMLTPRAKALLRRQPRSTKRRRSSDERRKGR